MNSIKDVKIIKIKNDKIQVVFYKDKESIEYMLENALTNNNIRFTFENINSEYYYCVYFEKSDLNSYNKFIDIIKKYYQYLPKKYKSEEIKNLKLNPSINFFNQDNSYISIYQEENSSFLNDNLRYRFFIQKPLGCFYILIQKDGLITIDEQFYYTKYQLKEKNKKLSFMKRIYKKEYQIDEFNENDFFEIGQK